MSARASTNHRPARVLRARDGRSTFDSAGESLETSTGRLAGGWSLAGCDIVFDARLTTARTAASMRAKVDISALEGGERRCARPM